MGRLLTTRIEETQERNGHERARFGGFIIVSKSHLIDTAIACYDRS